MTDELYTYNDIILNTITLKTPLIKYQFYDADNEIIKKSYILKIY